MCVLTYIPQKDNGTIAITHNRDEHSLRPPAIAPQAYNIENELITYPIDPQGGGTWFAQHQDFVCCLLNGAFQKHECRPPYRVSRGTIILSFFKYKNVQHFLQDFDAQGIEPFTLIIFDLKKSEVHQFVWDEKVFHHQQLDSQKAHIWSSSTLYNDNVKQSRKNIFDQFTTIQPSGDEIINFHETNIDNDLHKSFFVNIENKIKTVAITQVAGKYLDMELKYFYTGT